MLLQTLKTNHRKFEIMHEIEALHDFATENSSPDIQEIEIDFVYNHAHYAVSIAFVKFLTMTEYQFRIGTFNRSIGFVDSILCDCEDFDEFFNCVWNML